MRVYFPVPLDLRSITDELWQHTERFEFIVEEEGLEPIAIGVPVGTYTNLASVPRLPVMYLCFGGIGNYAAAAHDHLYTPPALYPREWCDAVFYWGLIASGIPEDKARPMWQGVNIGGEKFYNKPSTFKIPE